MIGDALAGCCPRVGRVGRYTQIPMYKPYPIGYSAGDPDRVSLPLAVPIASNALAGSRGKGMGAVHRSPLRG